MSKTFLKFGWMICLSVILFNNASAQVGNGSSSTTSRGTDNKADQNLKSIARINPSTLAMEMSIPLMTYPGRNGNAQSVGFNYSSKLWRMRAGQPWWYYQNTRLKFVTDITTVFAERTAAGWSSNLLPPRIEEKSEVYSQDGHPYMDSVDETGLNAIWQNILQSFSPTNLLSINDCQGSVCCTTYLCTAFHPSDPASDYICRCTNWTVGATHSGPGTPPPPIPTQLYQVRRLRIAMGDGATHEFRASDQLSGCGTATTGCPNESNGTYLSVDGSGMRLVRDSSGSILYRTCLQFNGKSFLL